MVKYVHESLTVFDIRHGTPSRSGTEVSNKGACWNAGPLHDLRSDSLDARVPDVSHLGVSSNAPIVNVSVMIFEPK